MRFINGYSIFHTSSWVFSRIIVINAWDTIPLMTFSACTATLEQFRPCCLQIKEHFPYIYMGLDSLLRGGQELIQGGEYWGLTIISQGTFINEWNWRQHFLHNFIHCEINFILFLQFMGHQLWSHIVKIKEFQVTGMWSPVFFCQGKCAAWHTPALCKQKSHTMLCQ